MVLCGLQFDASDAKDAYEVTFAEAEALAKKLEYFGFIACSALTSLQL